MKRFLLSYLSEFFLSDKRLQNQRVNVEKKRIRNNQKHCLEVFIAIDDPCSFLLLQVLADLKQRYDLSIVIKTVLNKQEDMFPDVKRWDENILNDTVRMARLYELNAPIKQLPDKELVTKASYALVNIEQQTDSLSKAKQVFDAVWLNEKAMALDKLEKLTSTETNHLNGEQCKAQLATNEAYLITQGHYLSGTILYGGEWYWGLERLQYLECRLNSLIPSAAQVVKFDKLHHLFQPVDIPITDNQAQLTIYFSIRSPYSYLGLLRSIKLAEHYQIPLTLKPVLPMLMRGMQVPKNKSMYIGLDTKREANSYGIEFGKIADPLGKGVERCYALFEYAKSEGNEIEFIKNYATAVWSQRIFSDTDKGLKRIVESSGLNWQKAQELLNDQSWLEWAEQNLNELFALGLWGVPSFKYKNTKVFGQDKLRFIEDEIRKNN